MTAVREKSITVRAGVSAGCTREFALVCVVADGVLFILSSLRGVYVTTSHFARSDVSKARDCNSA